VISRRLFLAIAGYGLLATPVVAQTPPGRVWRIGWLSPPSGEAGGSELDALRQGLRELGYVEGRNIVIEARWAAGDQARLPTLARTLVDLKVDVICTAGTPATLAAKHATSKIPIVFGRAAFPEQTGLVDSVARPGGNLTGVAWIGPEYGKRLELLREVTPSLSRVALLYNDKNPASVLAMEVTRQWARDLHLGLEPHGVHDRPGLDAAFAVMRRRSPDALMTTSDPVLSSYRAAIVGFAAERRLLSMYGDRIYVTNGGLMFYGTSTSVMWRQAAIYVDRIFKGAKPGDLPVEQPTKFELVINMKTAGALGLAVPQSVLARADETID
jgi:putative tryptophan/tyrosine transport system substrate-binding protein